MTSPLPRRDGPSPRHPAASLLTRNLAIEAAARVRAAERSDLDGYAALVRRLNGERLGLPIYESWAAIATPSSSRHRACDPLRAHPLAHVDEDRARRSRTVRPLVLRFRYGAVFAGVRTTCN